MCKTLYETFSILGKENHKEQTRRQTRNNPQGIPTKSSTGPPRRHSIHSPSTVSHSLSCKPQWEVKKNVWKTNIHRGVPEVVSNSGDGTQKGDLEEIGNVGIEEEPEGAEYASDSGHPLHSLFSRLAWVAAAPGGHGSREPGMTSGTLGLRGHARGGVGREINTERKPSEIFKLDTILYLNKAIRYNNTFTR